MLPVVGEKIEGTRMYEQYGSSEDLSVYFEFLCEAFGGLVSPGGVAAMAGVTRAAVHKRMKAGKLTAFLYHTSIGKNSGRRITPFCHIPCDEVKAWREEIIERAESKLEAFNVTKKDYDVGFMQKNIREVKKELKKRGIPLRGEGVL